MLPRRYFAGILPMIASLHKALYNAWYGIPDKPYSVLVRWIREWGDIYKCVKGKVPLAFVASLSPWTKRDKDRNIVIRPERCSGFGKPGESTRSLPRWKGRFCRPSIIRYSGDDTVWWGCFPVVTRLLPYRRLYIWYPGFAWLTHGSYCCHVPCWNKRIPVVLGSSPCRRI